MRGARAPVALVQAVTAAALNETNDAELFARVDAVVATAGDEAAARRTALAPFVTNALALRVYNYAQTLRKA